MKPFLQGRKTLADAPLRARAARPGPAGAGAVPAAAEAHGPQVEVIKEGDKVVRLIITCACGERTEVDCLYSGRG